MGASALVQRGVDEVGELGEPLLAALERFVGRRRRGRAEHVAELQLAEPAAQPFQALLFLVEFCDGELALGDLAIELGLVLRALAQELDPLLLPRRGERASRRAA